MDDRTQRKAKTPWLIGILMTASLAMLFILQATNLWKEFSIDSSSDLLILYGLSSLNFIAFVIFAFIFLRSLIKLLRERRTLELGSKIKTRLLIYFVALSLLPIIAMALFSYLFLNRALERWFTQIPENVIREARELQRSSEEDRVAAFNELANVLAVAWATKVPGEDELAAVAGSGRLSHVEVVSLADGGPLVTFSPVADAEARARIATLAGRLRSMPTGGTLVSEEGLRGSAVDRNGRRVILVRNDDEGRTVSQVVERSVAEFDRLKQKQIVVRQVGLLTLGVLTFLLLFASTWIAFYVARGLTGPIKALAQGAEEISKGNYGHRLDVLAEDELAMLVNAFNQMSGRLQQNAQELEERRRYIETVLESLPTGVLSVDNELRITTLNAAAGKILQLRSENVLGTPFRHHLPDNAALRIEALLSRAKRVGYASDQIGGDTSHEMAVAITVNKLSGTRGYVIVLEDLSQLIAAQRAAAWQEVAKRMAHEIKNPLTPIQLSAERIVKRADAANGSSTPEFRKVLDESTSTILREVSSLKTLVDEFSRFARLPETVLTPGDLNLVAKEAIASFQHESHDLRIESDLDDDLPQVPLDAEQMKRVFINLMKNSAEAVGGMPGRHYVRVSTCYDKKRQMVVAEVADNGKGIRRADRSKLFQPYFSTKGRGTGLGLAIVHRIISEHHGQISVTDNTPTGAKFLIEIPIDLKKNG